MLNYNRGSGSPETRLSHSSGLPAKGLLLVIVMLTMGLSGCVFNQAQTANENASSSVSNGSVGVNSLLDETIGTYGVGRENDLILVTMDSDIHAGMLSGNVSAQLPESEELPPVYASFISGLETRYQIRRVADWPIPSIDINCLVFEVDTTQNKDQLLAALNDEPQIDTAQAMKVFDLLQSETTDDPYLPLQHGFQDLQASQSHRWSRGKDVVVAVIDTGADTRHPELQDRIINTRNFVDKDEQLFQQDSHGTAVAGVISAETDNNIGMAGIAPDANLLVMKACWQKGGQYNSQGCNTFTLAKALNFAIAQSVDVINLSLAGPRDPLLERLLATAMNSNIVVVGAASSNPAHQFPQIVPGTISVASSTSDISGNTDLLAPGQKILSTQPDDSYEFYTGSSFSTAHVSGLVALIKEHEPEWSSSETLRLLKTTTDPETGLANACHAVASLVNADVSTCLKEGAAPL